MKVRDLFAVINGDDAVLEMPGGGLEIVADDGRCMFALRITKDGTLEVSGGNVCRHAGKVFDDRITIYPRACNTVYICKPELRKNH